MTDRHAIVPLPPVARRRVLSRAALAFGAATLALTFGAAAQAQTLTVWSGYPEMEPFYKKVGESLKKKYPNLQVKVEAIPLREHEKRLALALPSGAAAEVIELANSTAQRYIEAGLMKPAPEDAAKFVGNAAYFDDFIRKTASVGGKVYGVPLFRGQGALYYNTEMFAKAGLSGPPKTMADYTDYAKKLTQRDGGKATVSGWSMRLSGGGQGIAEKFWINLFQNGGNLIEEQADGKWVTTYASEAGRKTLRQYVDNVFVDKVVTPEMPADADAFEREQTAMFIRESWVIGDIAQKAPKLKYGTALLPRGTIVAPVFIYSGADGEKGKLAFDFAVAANDPENAVWLLDNVGWLPNRKDVDYGPVVAKTPAIKAFVEYPKDYAFFTLPAIAPVEEILSRLAARLVKAFGDPSLAGNDAAIDAFLKEAAAETDTILKRANLLGSK
jgi:multiple sugar transport system substrate-binding protein